MPVIEPIKVDFGKENNKALEDYVVSQIRGLEAGHKELFTTDLPRWRRIYKGIPEEETRNWPWKNASNLVIQLVGMYSDQLLARVIAAKFEISPIVSLCLFGSWEPEEGGNEQKQILEEFMNLMAMSKDELDLYRVEYGVDHDAIKFGLGVCKDPWETQVEHMVVGERDGELALRQLIKDGPRPEKLAYESFMCSTNAPTVEKANFKVHIKTLTKYDLQERAFDGVYDKKAVDKIIQNPDRPGPDFVTQQQEQDKGEVKTAQGYENAEWDLYECWFPYIHNNHKYRIIYTYHLKSSTVMRAIFNFMPEHEEPFKTARLGYEGDTVRGRGFCDMLGDYQETFSTTYNQDNDAGTLANTSIYRLDPSSKLDAQFSIYPSACVPAREGEFEVFQMGRTSPDTVNRQRLTLQLAQERAGVAPPTGGSGSGITNPRKGIYSAMGTFAVLQDGNRRTNINVADMRYFHVALCTSLLRQYAEFGIGERINQFGTKAKILQKALENIKAKRIGINVRQTTASINKEVEKQGDILLNQAVRQHYTWVGNLLATLPQAPQHMQDYIVNVIAAADMLMQDIMRSFGKDDVSRYIPQSMTVKRMLENARGQVTNNGGANGESQAGNAPQNTVLPTAGAEQGANAGVAALAGR